MSLVEIGMTLLGALLLLGLYAFLYFRERNGEWHSSGSAMYRYVNGQWQTREMTSEEADHEFNSRQW